MGEVTRLAAAEEFEQDAGVPGFEAARETARCWAAGVDPLVTVNLLRAAAVLAGPAAKKNLADPATPHPSSVQYIDAVTGLEDDVHDLGRRGVDLGTKITEDLAAAREERRKALAEEREARARASSATTDTARNEQEAKASAAKERAHEAYLVIGDCEAALEIIEGALTSINTALRALWQVPEDFVEYFDVPLELAARGVRMPHGGYFFGEGEAA